VAGGRGVHDDVIQVENRFYILASSPLADVRRRVLKHDATFAVFDQFGDISSAILGEAGLYHQGTRHLSRLLLRLEERRPLLLSSSVRQDNSRLAVDLSNADVTEDGHLILPRDTVHVFRETFLWRGACFLHIHVRNYARTEVRLRLGLAFAADFVDEFEVRGIARARHGEHLEPRVQADAVLLAYHGLDDRVRRTLLRFDPAPETLDASAAEFRGTLPAGAAREIAVVVRCDAELPEPKAVRSLYLAAGEHAAQDRAAARAGDAGVRTSNELFDEWWGRSAFDLHMMVAQTPQGPYPHAGVPWFSTVFGRDGIWTALQCLWVNPRLARGVLGHLAATQAREFDPARDAQPGKILHEARHGEMAALGEVPFGRYYGSVDATPLFVVLAGAYYRRTGDRQFLRRLWPSVVQALRWMDEHGDIDGDGFLEYARQSTDGLVTQGWKDSADSVFHADGELARPPVALCEVQGYAFAALRAAAELAGALGLEADAERLSAQAQRLRARFEAAFWCDDLGTYALALDADKRPCRVRTSNPGHCLFAGIAAPERAARTVRSLLDETSFSGFGVRTVATDAPRYNPMSYHNGSVWPHDNAILAAGFARYGAKAAVVEVLGGLFDASTTLDLHCLPELFCGFRRRPHEGPTLYPLACAPQAWSAGAVALLLQAVLGLSLDAIDREVRFVHPVLPEWLEQVRLTNLRLPGARVDLLLTRHRDRVVVEVTGGDGRAAVRVLD